MTYNWQVDFFRIFQYFTLNIICKVLYQISKLNIIYLYPSKFVLITAFLNHIVNTLMRR